MFTSFFYLLKAKGFNVSLQEWFTLLDGLQLELHESSLTGFYHLARATLVKTEADFDKFDLAFVEFFKGIKAYDELPAELLEWLSTPDDGFDQEVFEGDSKLDMEELLRKFKERLNEQNERHDGGNYWVGTGGTSPFGNSGYHPGGIRVGGVGVSQSALKVAGERNYRDFREDNVLDDRQYQMAFRSLRQFSTNEEGPKDELKLDETIDKTCENAGNLKLVFGRPRRNAVKLVVLFDSGGSMLRYARLCSSLFQAASKSNHFKDLKTYYFHNCFYHRLYTTPYCADVESVETEWVLQNLKSDYRVIVVGDASMDPYELLKPGGCLYYYHYNDYNRYNEEPGIEWIRRFRKKYKKMIWLNPADPSKWEMGHGSTTIMKIKEEVPMYHLSIKGLQAGLKSLIAAR
jgi:uncharacterized protein with von Willebrand factor type A (vWA) domain